MIRCLLATLLFTFAAGAAQAQLRSIPAAAKRATLSHVQGMTVEIDGKRVELAAGAQIRDGENRILVPTAVPPGVRIKYLADAQGQVARIWILSPQEAAQPDSRK
ncbi:MAG: hypothetical protein EXR32_08965 [Betaproteobacteria bacterium]|nr:hypothetical protein [Betaproteobacteria bacterium]